MTNKEYREKRDNIYEFTFWDHLTSDEIKQIRKNRKLENAVPLPGANDRAYIRKDGENVYTLVSYFTDVCQVAGTDFIKLWDGYSVTTMKHINAFCNLIGRAGFNKRSWIEAEAGIIK